MVSPRGGRRHRRSSPARLGGRPGPWCVALCVAARCTGAAAAVADAPGGAYVASAEDLFECLGVRAGPSGLPEAGAAVELLDCDSAQETGSQGAAFLRWRLPPFNASQAPLQLLGTPANRSLCLGSPTASSPEAPHLVTCDAAATAPAWRWDMWLRLVPSWDGGLCLARANTNTSLQMEGCSKGKGQSTHRTAQQWQALPTGTAEALAAIRPPLRASGRYIVDARGVRIKLAGANWAGAHMEHRTNSGLELLPVQRLARLVRRLGFNHVRLNYAVEMLWDTRPVPLRRVAANPDLARKLPIEVFDACVKALTDEGVLVVINAHTSDYRWCCSLQDEQALWWNSRWPEAKWLESLASLAGRYKDNSRVIGFDLRNEPRPDFPDGSRNPILIWWDPGASWPNCTSYTARVGSTLQLDLGAFTSRGICLQEHTANLRRAMEQGALAVWNGNPDALAFIEGAGGADLMKALEQPLQFKQPCLHSRVVFSIHDYSWAARWFALADLIHLGGGSFGEVYERLQVLYRGRENEIESGWEQAAELRRKAYGYLLEGDLAPVWIGEFGTGEGYNWWSIFARYAEEQDLDWAYWHLGGYKYPPGVSLYDGGAYMDAGQKIPNLPGGVTQDYIKDDYGLLEIDHRAVQFPRKLQFLIDLAAARRGPGVDGATARRPPRECVFDAAASPVTGTGPLPQGFAAYAKVSKISSCAAVPQLRERRRLSSNETDPLVDDQDWDLAKRVRARRQQICTEKPADPTRYWRGQWAGYEDVRKAAQHPNPVQGALESATLQQTGRALVEQAKRLVDVMQIFWMVIIVIGVIVVVWTLYHLRPGHCRGHCRSRSAPVTRAVRRAAGRVGCRLPRPPPRISRAARDVWEMNHIWRPMAAVAYFMTLIWMVFCIIHGVVGRARVEAGASSMTCSTLAFADDTLQGDQDSNGNAGFLGFLPTLELVAGLMDNLEPGGAIYENLTALRTGVEAAQAAFLQVQQDLATLQEAASQPQGDCVFGKGLVEQAQHLLLSSPAAALASAAPQVEDVLRDSKLQALQQDLAKVMDPVHSVKTVVMLSVSSFFDSINDPGNPVAKVITLVLYIIWAFFLLLLPTFCCGTHAAARLLCNKLDDGCCGSKDGCLKPYDQRAPITARFTWMCAFIYASVALLIALTLQILVRQGANFCVALDGVVVDGIAPYAGGLGLPQDPLVRNLTVDVFQTCMTRGGSGKLLDVIALDGCNNGGQLLDGPDTLMDRLTNFQGTLLNWTGVLQHGLGGRHFGNATEVQALLAQLEAAGAHADAIASTPACSKQDFACPALPPSLAPGRCNASELAARAAGLAQQLRGDVAGLDGVLLSFHDGLLTGVVGSLTQVLIDTLSNLLRAVDCGYLGHLAGDLVDAACLGILAGLQDVCLAHYLLAGPALFLAVTQYVLWRHLLSFFNHYHTEPKTEPAKADGGDLEGQSAPLEEGVQQAEGAAVAVEQPELRKEKSSGAGLVAEEQSHLGADASELETRLAL